jgi:hypothetical protein
MEYAVSKQREKEKLPRLPVSALSFLSPNLLYSQTV